YSADRSNVVDDSAEGSVIRLGAAGMKFEDLDAVRRANDLVVEVRGTSASMRIKDYYASTQTSWVFEDAQGNTTTGEALVAASQTDWAQLQANLLKDFQSSALGSISRGYSDNGYTQRVDGSWYQAASYGADISRTYVKRTGLFRDIWNVTSSHVEAEGWSGDVTSPPASDTTATITFQTNIVASGADTLQSYNYSSSLENAWTSVSWTKDSSSHFESDWNLVYHTGTMTGYSYTRVDIDTDYYTGRANQLTFQDPGAPALAGNLPSYVAVDFWHRQDSYNLGPSLLADGDQTVSADGYSVVIGGVGNNTIYGAGFAYGGTGNAQLIGGGTLMAGTGDQLLQFGKIMVVGDGHDSDTIQENDTTAGNTDTLQFMAGINSDQLWFRKAGNNLEVSILGTADKATVQNWYLGSAYHVEQIKAGGGKVLLDTQVQQLVQAMALFKPPPMGQTTLTSQQQTALAPVLAASWH
ncbi:hypothetical protein PMI15_03010, partial [Polaromonas sp. CF318]|uniref:calcium-binding protein n=1 Tax=Polaromonas sp. CF318 TaxID=1144318 RepID=UPI000270E31D